MTFRLLARSPNIHVESPIETKVHMKDIRSKRIFLRVTPQEHATLRQAATVLGKSLNRFVLESAGISAEHALHDRNTILVPSNRYKALANLIARPSQENEGLRKLFAYPTPWVRE